MLDSQPVDFDLCDLARSAARVVAPLAEQLDARVSLSLPATARAYATSDPAILRQLLVQVIGLAVQASPRGEVAVRLVAGEAEVTLSVVYPRSAPSQSPGLADAQRVALSQGIGCTIETTSYYDQLAVALRFAAPGLRSVLIVEDNQGAVELYRRYLDGSGWRVYSTSEPRLAVATARSIRPTAIILDIMMPGLDGWGVLEQLMGSPDTASIPVLICSVVQDIQLGSALGAAAYLEKPVSRGELLSTLSRLGRPD
ncbi:MAG: response regulator [Anaerolineae bacterium]